MTLLLRAALLIAPLVVVAGGGATAGAQQVELQGVVGPGFTITLTRGGTRVTNLEPGAYTIRIDDRSDEHNFHLSGPGVNERTAVEFVGQTTWNVMLQNGTYTYVCDPHAPSMKGSFTVGAAPAPQVRPLRASVGPGKRITLVTGAGAKVKTLQPGRYRITVRDRSTVDNLHLIGPGVNRKTGIKFRGTATWTVTLKAGTYRYRSDATRRLRGSFTVRAPSAHVHP